MNFYVLFYFQTLAEDKSKYLYTQELHELIGYSRGKG